MTSADLSLGAPDWVIELAGVAGVIQEQLASTGDVGQVHVRPSIPRPTDFTVSLGWHRPDPPSTAFLVGYMVAEMWPPWLAEWGVGLEMVTADWRCHADCGLMVELAEGAVSRPEWLLRCTA